MRRIAVTVMTWLVWAGFSGETPAFSDTSLPDAAGPYSVGAMHFSIPADHRPGIPIPVEFFYPSTSPGAVQAFLHQDPLPPFVVLPAAVYVVLGMDPVYSGLPSSGGPLVVLSPGHTAPAAGSYFLAARIASWGFNVAVITHRSEGALCEFPPGPHPYCDPAIGTLADQIDQRRLDISRVLDWLMGQNGTAGIDFQPDEIFGVGHSLGAMGLVSALGHGENRIKALISLDGALGYGPDPDALLAAVSVPTFLLGEPPCQPVYRRCEGGLECEEFVKWDASDLKSRCASVEDCLHTLRAQALIPSNPDLVILKRGEHVRGFSNLCEQLIAFGLPPAILPECVDPALIPIPDARRLVNRYVVAFLLERSGTPGMHRYLDPGSFATHEPEAWFIKGQPGSAASLEHGDSQASFFCAQPGNH